MKIEDILADSGRPKEDRDRDITRRPAEVLRFLGIQPGERVADIMPGGTGYFSRLFSRAVGPNGVLWVVNINEQVQVTRWNPDFSGADYSNVRSIFVPVAKLGAPEPLDMIFMSQQYHDFFRGPWREGMSKPEHEPLTRAMFNMLKPGGRLVIIDHIGAADIDATENATRLHRITEDAVRRAVEKAGFVFEKSSDVLRNPDDNHSLGVFNPAIRGRTDQMLLVFRRPLR